MFGLSKLPALKEFRAIDLLKELTPPFIGRRLFPELQIVSQDYGEYQKIELRSGIQLHLTPYRGRGQVFVTINIDVGSQYEKPHEEGFAHLLEHLILERMSPLVPRPFNFFRFCI